jgi:mono/diheme cytochrome c family protein
LEAAQPAVGGAEKMVESNGKYSKIREGSRTMTLKAIAMVFALALGALGIASAVGRTSNPDPSDAAANYKKLKCVTCHGAKAEKKFDLTKSDDDHVQIILKGKKLEKPPHMPGYEAKGVTADQAKALLEYMKSLRQ